jgi:steroid 5-alpha reductase family enzyme
MTTSLIWSALVIVLIIQLLFFVFAALKKTDQVTDLSYGLSFVLLAILTYLQIKGSLQAMLLTIVISIWGVRLAGFLFMRIRKLKKDARFDGIREKFWKFAQFWLLQGVSIWVIMLAALVFYSKNLNTITLNPLAYVFLGVAVLGIILETIADNQKFAYKNDAKHSGHWADVGLYKFSRHPNYLGELLMWWGVFGFIAPTLMGWEWLTIISPLYISLLLLHVTGIPTTEKRNDKIYANNKEYGEYKKRTGLLLPKFN